MRTVDVLHDLQGLDTQLDAARAALAQIQKELGDRSALEPLSRQITELRAALHQIEAEQRDLELNAEGKRNKIATDDGKLYGGKVTNPKELDSLSQEIQQEKQQLGIVEDRLLELIDASEQSARQIADAERDLAAATQAWETRQSRAKSQVEELEGTIGGLDIDRAELVAQVDAPTRVTYDNLRRQKGGVAVAQVLQHTCQACRVSSLTPALEQRARIGAQLVTCPSCGRIVFMSLT